MCDNSWLDGANKTTRALQLIVGAMTLGLLSALLVISTARSHAEPPATPPQATLALLAAALIGVGLIARAIVLWTITTKGRREIVNGTYTPVDPRQRIGAFASPEGLCRDEKYLLSVFQNKTIISARAVRGMGVLCDGCVFHRGQSPLHWSGYRPDTRRGRALSNAVSCTRLGRTPNASFGGREGGVRAVRSLGKSADRFDSVDYVTSLKRTKEQPWREPATTLIALLFILG